MALVSADRVKDSTTTTGTGSLTLSGTAPTGYQAFASVMAANDTCYYCISSTGGAEWEVGLGTLTASTTLARTTVIASSNLNALVSLSAGTKDVFITAPASIIVPGAWTPYTATVAQGAGTIAYGTREAAYEQTGKTVRGRFMIPLAAGTAGTAGQVITIPYSALPAQKTTTNNTVVGTGLVTNGTNTNWIGALVVSAGNWVIIGPASSSATGNNPAVTLGSGYVVAGTFQYEAA